MPFRCTICNVTTIHLSSFKRHVSKHTGEGSHSCPICQKKFYRLDYMRRHLKTHGHGNRDELDQLIQLAMQSVKKWLESPWVLEALMITSATRNVYQLPANLCKPLWYRQFQNLLILEVPPDFTFVYLPEFGANTSEHHLLIKLLLSLIKYYNRPIKFFRVSCRKGDIYLLVKLIACRIFKNIRADWALFWELWVSISTLTFHNIS